MQVFVSQLYLNKVAWEKSDGYHLISLTLTLSPCRWNIMKIIINLGLPGGSVVKNLLAMQETQVQSLGWEDPLEKEMATHASLFAWENPWTEELGRLQSMGSQRNQTRHRD